MMIRVNGEYLDFNDSIAVEKQNKIFEELDATVGDFSYSFTVPITQNNLNILGLPDLADISNKTIYQNVICDLVDEDGIPTYKGQIRVERVTDGGIECSFFAGNYNWFNLITGSLIGNEDTGEMGLDFSEYDTEISNTNIFLLKDNTEGLILPLIDTGALITRSYSDLKVEDFIGCMYVKTIFKKIFDAAGIKVSGELINDPVFQSMIVAKNNRNGTEINANSSFVEKTTTTARPIELDFYKVTFQNDSVYPYFDGSNDNFDLANSRFIAPYKMRVRVEVSLVPSIIDAGYNNRIYLYINGVFTFVDIGLSEGGLYNAPTAGDQSPFTLDRTIILEEGDILEIYSQWQQSTGSTQNDVLSGTVRITPDYIYGLKGKSTVPNWTRQEFVINILNLFNVVSDFNPVTKELTLNLFDRIKDKTPIDISEYITRMEFDYSEFISNYGRENNFTYQESDDEEVRDYNISKFVKYGAGVILVNNDFIEDSADFIESDFKAPISYINPAFGASLERINIVTLSEESLGEFSAVINDAGQAVLDMPATFFTEGDLIRIKETPGGIYNGDWVVNALGTGEVFISGLTFKGTSSGKVFKLTHEYTTNDDVYIFLNSNQEIDEFSYSKSAYQIFDTSSNVFSNLPYPYFNLLDTGTPVNGKFGQSLSFGNVSSPYNYQRSLIDTYWRNVDDILNDPVMCRAIAYLPKSVFLSLTPLAPVYIKSKKTNNLYYINRISGYENSYTPCEIELIKL